MSALRIIVRVSIDGATQIKSEGFQGSHCLKATEELERALGLAGQRLKTAEFYQSASNSTLQSVDAAGSSNTTN